MSLLRVYVELRERDIYMIRSDTAFWSLYELAVGLDAGEVLRDGAVAAEAQSLPLHALLQRPSSEAFCLVDSLIENNTRGLARNQMSGQKLIIL